MAPTIGSLMRAAYAGLRADAYIPDRPMVTPEHELSLQGIHARREFKLICPKSHMTRHIKDEIIDKFGGATFWGGTGAWRDGRGVITEEEVVVAAIASSHTDEEMITFVKKIRDEAEQECMYLRLRSGNVVYVF